MTCPLPIEGVNPWNSKGTILALNDVPMDLGSCRVSPWQPSVSIFCLGSPTCIDCLDDATQCDLHPNVYILFLELTLDFARISFNKIRSEKRRVDIEYGKNLSIQVVSILSREGYLSELLRHGKKDVETKKCKNAFC